MYGRKCLVLSFLIAMLLFGMVNVAQAQDAPPILPSSFYGEIHISDDSPAAGSVIQAFVPGHAAPIASATVKSSGENLVYSINLPGDDGVTLGGMENDAVTFQFGGRILAMGTWHTGTNVRLNLHPPAADAGDFAVGRVDENIQLSGSGSDWLGTESLTYAWDLDGDGAYDDSNLQNPSYAFTTTGTKQVGLQVTDSQGGVGTATTTVVVAALGGFSGQTYDGSAHAVSVSGVELPLTYTITYAGSTTAPANAGSYAVVVSVFQDSELLGTLNDTLVINLKAASVTPEAARKTYGSVDPVFTGALSGFLPGDNVTAAYSRDSGENAGTYSIHASLSPSAVLENYAITYHTGAFTIDPKTITVTATGGQTKVYGDSDPVLPYTSSEVGASFTGALSRAAGTVIGEYAITLGNLSAGNNYLIDFTSATFTITARPVTVSADAKAKAFGAADPELTYQITSGSLVTGDNFTGALTRTSGEAVGAYAIQQGTLSLGSNYSLSFVPAYLTIQAVQHSVTLSSGWNLVSFNIRPSSTAIADVLVSIEGNYDLVYAWDASGSHAASSGNWLKYDNLPETTDTLTILDETMGFWIHMTAADTLDVAGTYQPVTTITLQTGAEGWNLVSYPSAANGTLPGTLADHGASGASLVYAYHAGDSADPWKLFDRSGPDYANDLDALSPGWGYWVKVDAENTWSIAY